MQKAKKGGGEGGGIKKNAQDITAAASSQE